MGVRAPAWIAAAALLGVATSGCSMSVPAPVGSASRTQSPWAIVTEGRADANGDGTGLSISTADWTYGGDFGFAWIDAMGSQHDGGRPDCLPPGASRMVRFAAVEVTVEGMTWRPIVLVDCR